MDHSEAYIFDSVRTPRGKGRPGGALYSVKPLDLAVGLIDAIRRRNPGLDPAAVDDVILGIVSPLDEQGGVLPRTAALASGLAETVPGVQVNRFCGSGLQAVNEAAAKVRSGWDDLVLAGGVESMSHCPIGSDGGALSLDPRTAYDTVFVPQGVGADLIATRAGYSRATVDEYAVRSQELAARAWEEGRFAGSIEPVVDLAGITLLDRDEILRPDATVERLASLPPAFAKLAKLGGFAAAALQKYPAVERIDHVHHAGNSSGIVDGAALVLVGTGAAGEAAGLTPRARVVSAATVGSEPTIMLTGPTPAAEKALAKAGLTVADIDLFEVNEAFAAVPLNFADELGIPLDKVNVNGGAIAMGHPLGATGCIILGTLLDELERTGGRFGLATLCVGGGMGIATIIERL